MLLHTLDKNSLDEFLLLFTNLFPDFFLLKNNAVEKLFAVLDHGKYLPLRIIYNII